MEDLKQIDEKEAAKLLGLSVRTLQSWRWLKKGPAHVKCGQSVRYRISDIKAYQEGNLVLPEFQVTK